MDWALGVGLRLQAAEFRISGFGLEGSDEWQRV